MNNPLKFRFHGLYDNTSNVLQGSNNFPYGAPKPSLADDTLPFGDETVTVYDDETGVKCYSCGGYFPESSCVANTLDEGQTVPVCETCAEGRVG